MEQVTEYNNVTREVKIQVRIFRELEVHGAGHRIQQCHTGVQYRGQNTVFREPGVHGSGHMEQKCDTRSLKAEYLDNRMDRPHDTK